MSDINKVLFGDCLELMKSIPNESIDMILCDLPYAVTARNEWDIIIPFDKLWEQYNRIIKNNGAIVLTGIQPFTSELILSNKKMFKYEWIWDKKKTTNFLNAKKQPLRQHESILVFYKKQPTYNPIPYKKNTNGMMSKKNYGKILNTTNYGETKSANLNKNDNEFGMPRSIINSIPVLNNLGNDKNGLHPTQKPIALFEYLIKTYTNENDLVLDNCAGSGTTAIACLNTNRKYILIEKENNYFNIILNRIKTHINQQKLF